MQRIPLYSKLMELPMFQGMSTDDLVAVLGQTRFDFAQKKAELIDPAKHFILKSAHPSPFSVYRGFFGSRPFSKINEYLVSKGKKPISW